jgi:hypothetical protein
MRVDQFHAAQVDQFQSVRNIANIIALKPPSESRGRRGQAASR